MNIRPSQFQKLVLNWFDQHGRKNFPWQKNKTAYRVWVSEIMLQQTQVNTVIPYYEKFMELFPDLSTLAKATEDKVLHAWAGLGYYSRARNLHRAAKMIMEMHKGKFPDDLESLQTLPGIGRSTAGAIYSIAYNQQAAILDGNVKRVLSRFLGITEPITDKKVEQILWEYAEKFMPGKRPADYTQAIMDLGATICIRKNPECNHCPLSKYCSAYQQEIVHLIPAKKISQELPVKIASFLILKKNQDVLLIKRPPMGIWGGLWSFPEVIGEPDEKKLQTYCRKEFGISFNEYETLDFFRHTFSHFHLKIHPVIISVKRLPARIMEDGCQIWYNPHQPASVGLPKPIETIMRKLK